MDISLVERLIDRFVQLFNVKHAAAEGTYKTYIEPAGEAFRAVHAAYTDSFQQYKQMIRSDPALLRTGSPLFDRIRDDHQLGATARGALLEAVRAGRAHSLEMYDEIVKLDKAAEAAIDDYVIALQQYLLRERAGDDRVLNQVLDEMPNLILTQRFRLSLLDVLEAVVAEDWQLCIDSSARAPLMTPEELAAEVNAVAVEAGIAPDAPDRDALIRQAFALKALNEIIDEMQHASVVVIAQFNAVKVALRITD